MKSTFERIYSENIWRHGSGEGSLLQHTKGYIAFLERFVREKKIRSIVDFGCGDWQFSRFIDWGDAQYLGCDVVAQVIEANQTRYGARNIRFIEIPPHAPVLPSADLLIIKDVLQHWSNDQIKSFLPVLRRYRYSLITNCVGASGVAVNSDIDTGDFRPLDIRKPPFEVVANEEFSFENSRPLLFGRFMRPRWRKSVLLVESPTEHAALK
jgi:SAM-dependent methyltransferase